MAELKPKQNLNHADSASSFLCIGNCCLSTNKFIPDMNMDMHRVHQDLCFWLETKVTIIKDTSSHCCLSVFVYCFFLQYSAPWTVLTFSNCDGFFYNFLLGLGTILSSDYISPRKLSKMYYFVKITCHNV